MGRTHRNTTVSSGGELGESCWSDTDWNIAVYDGETSPSIVNVTDSTIKGNAGVAVYGTNKLENIVNLTRTTIQTDYVGVYQAGMMKVEITDCNIAVQDDSAVEVRAGIATIRNSSLYCAYETATMKASGNGTTTRGAALAVAPHTTGRTITVAVIGGTLKAAAPVFVGDPQNSDSSVTVSVENAAVRNLADGEAVNVCKNTYTDASVTVNGQKIEASVVTPPADGATTR